MEERKNVYLSLHKSLVLSWTILVRHSRSLI